MIVFYVLIQIELLGTLYPHISRNYSEMHEFGLTDVFSYSHLTIVDIFISLISKSDVNVFVYTWSTRVFNSTD